jgi:hypothetical protein
MITAYSGGELAVFWLSSNRVWDTLATTQSPPNPVNDAQKSFIANWKNQAGVADSVRSLSLSIVRANNPDDKAAIEQAVSEIAENSPTTDTVWLDLAEIRLARGASMESVLAAFHMSHLTGSHEGFTMERRAIFGLEHWTELPEADRHIVVRDVAATIGPVFRHEERYRKILATKSQDERDEVRAALTKFGLATPAVLQALGE